MSLQGGEGGIDDFDRLGATIEPQERIGEIELRSCSLPGRLKAIERLTREAQPWHRVYARRLPRWDCAAYAALSA